MSQKLNSPSFGVTVVVILSLFLIVGGVWIFYEGLVPQPRVDSPSQSPTTTSLNAVPPLLPVVVPKVRDDLPGEYVWCNETSNSTGLSLRADGTCVVEQGSCFGDAIVLTGTWSRNGDELKFDFPTKRREDWFRPTSVRVVHVQPGYLLVIEVSDAQVLTEKYGGKGLVHLFNAPRIWLTKAYAPFAVYSELYRATGGRFRRDDPLTFTAQP